MGFRERVPEKWIVDPRLTETCNTRILFQGAYHGAVCTSTSYPARDNTELSLREQEIND